MSPRTRHFPRLALRLATPLLVMPLLVMPLLVGAALAAQEAPAAPATAVPAAAVPAAAAPEQPARPQWAPAERAAIELLRGLRRKERPSDEESAAKLALGGESILPLLFDVLALRVVPVVDPAPAPGQAPAPTTPAPTPAPTPAQAAPQILSEIQENVVLLALAQLEREPVLSGATAAVHAEPTPARRAAALECIGAVGHANDLPELFELALTPDERQPDEHLERALRRAVANVLAHDPRAVEQLITLRRVTRPELLQALVEAVGVSKNPRGLAYLSEIAYWNEGLILDVMSQVPLLGLSGDEAVDTAMKVRLRPYIDESRPGPCRAAILALTALDDVESIAPLIAVLASENAGLRENAHWALKKLTGLTLADTADVWSHWHQGELFWMLREKPHEFQRLKESQAAVVADALRAILAHPLARKELSSAVPDLLKSRFPAIRVLACRTLSDLDAQDAVSKLVWALDDPTPEVSQAAHAALRKLTRLDLPLESLAWQTATNTAPKATEL